MKYELTANRLKEAMNDIGIKAQQLADDTGILKSSISQYVNGSHAPSNIKANQLGKRLHVNPLWLMGFDVSKDAELIPAVPSGTGELLDLFSRATPDQREAVINLLRSFVSE